MVFSKKPKKQTPPKNWEVLGQVRANWPRRMKQQPNDTAK